MHIRVERTGGFAGIARTHSVSTSDLSAEQAQRLQSLVDSSNFYQLPTVIPSTGSVRDAFQYKITVDDEQGAHTVQVDESAIPPGLKPLLEWFHQH